MIHFHFNAPNISDWLTFIVSFLSFITVSITLYIGWKALGSWRQEKRHDVLVRSLAIANKALNYIKHLRSPAQFQGEIDEQIKILYADQSIPDEVLLIESRMNRFRPLMDEVHLYNEIILVEHKEEHILHRYFQQVIDINEKVLTASDTYARYIVLIEKGVIKKNETKSELNNLRRIIFQLTNDQIFPEFQTLYNEVVEFRRKL